MYNCTYVLYTGYKTPDYLDEIVSVLENEVEGSTYGNSYSTCIQATTNAKNCGDYSGCSHMTIDTSDINSNNYGGPVCCTSYYGCDGSQLTSKLNFDDHLINIAPTAIRCDGSYSCLNASLIGTSNGGHVYFSGSFAGVGSTVDGITGDYNYNVYCTAVSSCFDSRISNFKNLYCNGYHSCTNTNGYNIGSVYVYGYLGASMSTLSNIFNNVYCAAPLACSGMVIDNVINGNILSIGYLSSFQSTINTVLNGSVIGIGRLVFSNSTISNVADQVIGIGESALYHTRIQNVANVCYCHVYSVIMTQNCSM